MSLAIYTEFTQNIENASKVTVNQARRMRMNLTDLPLSKMLAKPALVQNLYSIWPENVKVNHLLNIHEKGAILGLNLKPFLF